MKKIIRLHDKFFTRYIRSKEIQKVVKGLAQNLYEDLGKDEVPIFMGILNGSFMFVSDFVKNYKGNCEVSFIKLASYEGTDTSGVVNELLGVNEDLTGRTIVILEDIIDTGNTLAKIYDIFDRLPIKQIKLITLFFKPDVFKKALHIDYVGMRIPDKFIVGYGLDYNALGRNYKDIYQIKEASMKNIVLFGHPGAGKGTQAAILKKHYGFEHISTGDVFRYHIKEKTDLGKLAQSYMDDGDLVPDEVTINMLKDEVKKYPEARGFIFDGFPRTTQQAIALDAFLAKKGEQINGMIALEVPENELVKRLLERGKTSGRPDDQNEAKIRHRFQEYEAKTDVLRDFYAKQGKFYGVQGTGSISEISQKLIAIIDTL